MKFQYNPRILEQLGTELIISDEVAFTELLKNSYDAKASKVKVHFLDSINDLNQCNLLTPINPSVLTEIKKAVGNEKIIILEDNGNGMDKQRLQDGFFTVGADLKRKMKKAAELAGSSEKMTLGDKGLGRLSSQRLASTLIIETTDVREKTINYVEIEWSRFFDTLEMEAPEKEFIKNEESSYTRLWFKGAVDFSDFFEDRRPKQTNLFGDDLKDEIYLREKLQSSVSFLYSPFFENQKDFEIKFYWNKNEVKSSFFNDSVNIAETIHSFSLSNKANPTINLQLELRPWYVEMIHLRLLGKNLFTERRKSPEFYNSLLEKYQVRLDSNLKKTCKLTDYLKDKKDSKLFYQSALEDVMPLESKVYSFHRESFRFSLALSSAKSLNFIKNEQNVSSNTTNYWDTGA